MKRRFSRRRGRASPWAVIALVCSGASFGQIVTSSAGSDAVEIRCSATSSAPIVRIEGTRELVGDVVLTCHSAGAASVFGQRGFLDVDVVLSLNVDWGNSTDFGLGADTADAVLVVNDDNCMDGDSSDVSGPCASRNGSGQGPALARLDASRRTLRWTGIRFPVPGASVDGPNSISNCTGQFGAAGGCHPATTTVRLTNLRANASQLGASGQATGSAVGIEASLFLRTADAALRTVDTSLRVAEAATGLAADAASPEQDRICSHGQSVAEVTLSEGFASAFKTAGEPSFRPGDPGWREGFYPHSGDAAGQDPGLRGTRLRIALARIPRGVSVIVPSLVSCPGPGSAGGLGLALVSNASSGGLGGSVARGQSTDRPLQMSSDREVSALYEVARSNPLARERCTIPFRFSRSAGADELFRGGTISVSASLAPFRTASASQSGVSERFTGVRVSPRPEFRLSGCGTTLFFPFVTNQRNFDTAVVIANTSADPLGTRHQSGACQLRYHGSGLDESADSAIQQSAEIQAGGQLAFTLSGGSQAHGLAPLTGFQGYLVAECGFQHGHGFAFVTEQLNGTAVLAQGYLAQIVRGPEEVGAAGGLP